MNRLYYYGAFFWCCLVCHYVFATPASSYLEGKIAKENHRYKTFITALDLMTQRGVKTIVETGTSRNGISNCAGDGCSTPIFAQWAKDHGAVLYSVDINPEAIRSAAQAVSNSGECVRFITGDSVNFLFNFEEKIDFLYLDSYDFEESSPLPSQMHHFREIVAAYPWLTPQSVVMIDDCGLPHGGKGKGAIEYLLRRGWVILQSGYQVILVKKPF